MTSLDNISPNNRPNKKITKKVDYEQNEHDVIWKSPTLQGGGEASLNNNPNECRKEFGPVTMSFDLPQFNIIKIQIKELKVNTVDKNIIRNFG